MAYKIGDIIKFNLSEKIFKVVEANKETIMIKNIHDPKEFDIIPNNKKWVNQYTSVN